MIKMETEHTTPKPMLSPSKRRLLAQILLFLGFLGHILVLIIVWNVSYVPYPGTSAGTGTIFMLWIAIVFAPLLGSMALVYYAGKLMAQAKENQ
jgi:hypothetical protein